MAFVERVVKATGRKQRIPEHWLDHPVFGPQFRLPPSVVAKAAEKPAKKSAPAKKADDAD